MTTAVLTVTSAGPHVSVQDAGRPGLMRFGVPQSGPMDRRSFAAANLALGNPETAPGIEISLGGLILECQSGSVTFAIAGGGFIVEHGGRRRGSWTVATITAGQTLTIRRGPWGSWCYLAVAGSLQAEPWLGSAATHALSGLGGGKLTKGTRLIISDSRQCQDGAIPCPVSARPRARARVTLGPQDGCFSEATLETFTSTSWRVTDAGDRMGLRLAGPSLAPDVALDLPTQPVVRGSVQVAGDGVASVLLADHQTTGGYPKIATVLDCDLDGFVQLRPGDRVVFQPVSPQAAVAIARRTAEAEGRYRQAITRLRPPC